MLPVNWIFPVPFYISHWIFYIGYSLCPSTFRIGYSTLDIPRALLHFTLDILHWIFPSDIPGGLIIPTSARPILPGCPDPTGPSDFARCRGGLAPC